MKINLMHEKDIKANPLTRLNVFCPLRPPHQHTFFEFVLVLNGVCKHSLNDGPQEELPAGTLLLIRPSEYHKIGFAGRDCIYRDYFATVPTMQAICNAIGEGFYEEIINNPHPYKINLSVQELNTLKNKSSYFDNWLVTDENNVHLSRLHRTILTELLGKFVELNLSKKAGIPDWLNDLHAHLTYFDYITLPLEEIVAKTGYSHGYVAQMFKLYFNESLISFHNKNKVIYSCKLLGNMRIIDIASMLGWENPKNYALQFQKVFGVSPSQYLKINRQIK